MSTDPAPLPTHAHSTTAIDAAIADLQKRVTALETAPGPTPPPVPAPLSGIYGPAINADTKSNIQVGWTNKAKVAHQFVAEHTGTIVGIRVSLRGGPDSTGKPVYSGGSGGTLECSIRKALDGPPQGLIGSLTPGNPAGAWTTYPEFSPSASVTIGDRLFAQFDNVDPNQSGNWVSVNEIYLYGSSPLLSGQRQPRWPDADCAVWESTGGWHVRKETMVMEVRYSDGYRQGQGYVGMIGGITGLPGAQVSFANISGNAKARQTLAAAGDFREAWVRVRRDHGTDPLFVTLRNGTAILAEFQVPWGSVPQSTAGGDNGGAVWVGGVLPSIATAPTELRLSCAAGSLYTTAPIRQGTDVGFSASSVFSDGRFEVTSDGTTWKDPYSGGILDMQMFLR